MILIEQKDAVKKNIFTGSDISQIINISTEKNEIILSLKDDKKNKSLRGYLKSLGNGKYSLKISDSKRELRKDKPKPGMTIPSEMILTEIE